MTVMANTTAQYQRFETTLPQPLWWSLKKRLLRINEHNQRAGLAQFMARQGATEWRDFPGEHLRMPMVPLGVYAGPPAHSDTPQGRPLAEQWARIESALNHQWRDDELLEMARARPVCFHTLSALAAGAAITRIDGGVWRSRKDSPEGTGSVDDVQALLVDPAVFEFYVTDADWDEATAALTYFRSPNIETGRSEYLARVSEAVKADSVSIASLGLASSAANAWSRAHAPDAGGNQREIADRTLGVPGDRIECQARVDKIIPMEGDYGLNYLTLFQDADTGARIAWINSGQQRFFEGDTYTIRATVKEHEQRDNHVQTNVTRVTSPDLRPHLKCDDIEAGKLDPDSVGLEKLVGWFKGASSMDARDEQGRTPLWRLCDLHARLDNSFAEAIEFLDEGDCDASIADLEGITPADHLAIAGCTGLLQSHGDQPGDEREDPAPSTGPGMAAS